MRVDTMSIVPLMAPLFPSSSPACRRAFATAWRSLPATELDQGSRVMSPSFSWVRLHYYDLCLCFLSAVYSKNSVPIISLRKFRNHTGSYWRVTGLCVSATHKHTLPCKHHISVRAAGNSPLPNHYQVSRWSPSMLCISICPLSTCCNVIIWIICHDSTQKFKLHATNPWIVVVNVYASCVMDMLYSANLKIKIPMKSFQVQF